MSLTINDLVALSHTRSVIYSGELRGVRQRSRLTQGEVASAVGVSIPVCQWESGITHPNSENARRLSSVLVALEACDAH
jgi:DNA-binding transcriptional regulator YiaG